MTSSEIIQLYSQIDGMTSLEIKNVISDELSHVSYAGFGKHAFGDSVFLGCINLKSIYCHVEDPNQINIERGVEYGGHQATLYVPAGKGVVAAYKKKAAWKKFAAIKPMGE